MMKKITLILFLFVGIFSQINAQDVYQGRKYGITLNAPTFSYLNSNDSNIKNSGVNLGYGVNIHAEFGLTNGISFVTGLSFASNVGGEIQHEYGGNLWPNAKLSNPLLNSGVKPLPDGTQLRYKLNTLSIPFGTKFYSAYRNSKQFFAEIPVIHLGFRLNAKGNINAAGNIETKNEDITTETRFMYVAAGGTVGVHYDLGSVQFEVGLNAQFWFTDMTRNNGIRVIDGTGGQQTQLDILANNRPVLIGLRFGIFF
jgi:hypothetical protein